MINGLPPIPVAIAFFGLVGLWVLLGLWLHGRDEG